MRDYPLNFLPQRPTPIRRVDDQVLTPPEDGVLLDRVTKELRFGETLIDKGIDDRVHPVVNEIEIARDRVDGLMQFGGYLLPSQCHEWSPDCRNT